MNLPVILAWGGAVLAGGIGLASVLKAGRSVARWSFAAGMAVLAAESVFSGLGAKAGLPGDVAYWEDWRAIAMSFLPGVWLVFSLSYGRGNSQEFLRKWVVWLAVAFVAPIGLVVVFDEELLALVARSDAGQGWLLRLTTPGLALEFFVLVSAILVLMNLERTYRAAVGTMRWRIKFMVIGLGILFAVRAYTSSQALLFRSIDLSLQGVNSAALLMACLLIIRSLFRAGHFEVSVYPSQSVLQNSFTVLIAGVYLMIVGVLAKLVAFLGGAASFELKAFLILVLVVLLTVALLSDRVRLHTKRFISRHFQRPLYDYRTVWRTFTEGTARRVEQGELCGAVVKLVSDIFQALSVSVWLVDERKEKLVFAASTSLSQAKAGHVTLEAADAADVIGALSKQPEPVDIDESKEIWAAALRRAHPEEFPTKGGNRVCVPLLAGGELLGVLMLGDRVGGISFLVQDLDLLKSVSDQAAAGLLNIQLSQRLSQAKQLEAFQAMSAFFVHDLKNTASTLSLMLQNLPVHYQDPAFREDALRGISKTVAHINDVISRLTVLRHELGVQAVECDLNELVEETLKTQEQAAGVQLVKELRPLPNVRVDPAQIQKVITNLVLNAREAVPAGGRVKVETSQRNGWVVLSVADNGCGMPAEFVRNSLFRPFQTTKKKGIGIGMFHCKMIVEAHRGRIEVESEVGKGTEFRVMLPVDHQSGKQKAEKKMEGWGF
ncbi:MAG TPA: XrtA/PEP-CTERM system histidine kinase PrsK [Verrucomicrobiae bacterium]|nr:XrtA/PEP-CTERM system histidine kinase PrsK [Verrucomicrobiae bacterium]